MKIVHLSIAALAMNALFPLVSTAEAIVPTEEETYRRIQLAAFSSPDSSIVHKAELIGTTNHFPQGKWLKIDGVTVGQNEYLTSKIMLGDVTGDQADELFFYQYSPGSAGAMGLNVYGLLDKTWKPIYISPSMTWGNDRNERFRASYLGSNRIRFVDNEDELNGVVDLSGLRFSEEQLNNMKLQVDPISEFDIHYENIGCGIETIQWIFAFSHPNAVFSIHHVYRYRFDRREFALYETKIEDNDSEILARKTYF